MLRCLRASLHHEKTDGIVTPLASPRRRYADSLAVASTHEDEAGGGYTLTHLAQAAAALLPTWQEEGTATGGLEGLAGTTATGEMEMVEGGEAGEAIRTADHAQWVPFHHHTQQQQQQEQAYGVSDKISSSFSSWFTQQHPDHQQVREQPQVAEKMDFQFDTNYVLSPFRRLHDTLWPPATANPAPCAQQQQQQFQQQQEGVQQQQEQEQPVYYYLAPLALPESAIPHRRSKHAERTCSFRAAVPVAKPGSSLLDFLASRDHLVRQQAPASAPVAAAPAAAAVPVKHQSVQPVPAAQPPLKRVCLPQLPVCTRPEYWTSPPMAELATYSVEQLSLVKDFTVHHKYGSVQFVGHTNLCGLNLDRIVQFECGGLEMYPPRLFRHPPARGQELNKPAIVTLRHCWPINKETGERTPLQGEERVHRYKCKIVAYCDSIGASFIKYESDTGTWVFCVDRFVC